MTTRRNLLRGRWQWLLVVMMLFVWSLPVHGQDIVPPFPPGPPLPVPPMPIPMPPAPASWVTVAKHSVEATVDGPVAEVRVEQVLRNDGMRAAEGVYLFPLPKDAAVSDFQMTVDGKTMEGKLLDSDEARQIYEEIVRRQLDPALLEYIGRGVFQANVFPIPPGETREVSFTYTQVLEQKNGLYRFNYPLQTRQLSSLPVESIDLQVNLMNEPGLRTLYSPSYPIQIERNQDDAATVTYATKGSEPQSDFDLYFGVDDQAIGLNLLSYRPAGEDGYFLLLASPSLDAAAEDIVARDIVLVVDVSGSMRGDKIKQARDAARFVVDHLNPDDRFNLISFSTGATSWQRQLQPVNPDTIKAAGQWIDRLRDGGSTDINRALLESLAQVGNDERPAYILFLTDGQPTQGEVNPDQIVANAVNNRPEDGSVRLFTFGIGYDVNTDLLDVLSQDLGGRASYVAPEEKIDEAVSAFYAQVSTPVLTDVSVDFGDNVMAEDLYPYPLPDLFAGEQLVVAGRYRESGPVEVTMTGAVNGREMTFVYPNQELVKDGGEPVVARLWATRKIGELLEQVRRTGANQELIDAIVELSLQYGIVTPYTSYLVDEPNQDVVVSGQTTNLSLSATPRAVGENAYAIVRDAAEAVVMQSASGAGAVAAAKTRDELQRATSVREDAAVRFINGRTFQQQGSLTGPDDQSLPLWVDTQYREDMKVKTIQFGSDEYFALLKRPELAAWLALSPELVLVTGPDEAIRITTQGEK